jgi:hypothetical protein
VVFSAEEHPTVWKALLVLILAWLNVSCRSADVPAKRAEDSSTLLPDLIIKKVTYRLPPSVPNVVPQRGGVFQPTYEFLIQVENIGTAPFAEPFLISYSTNLIDFQNHMYSKQVQFNETRMVIAPGKSLTFSLISEVEIPRISVGLTTLPMRFLLNYDWKSYTSRPQTVGVRESNYDNNSYELSLRIQLRR